MFEWCSEKWLLNQLLSEQTIYCMIYKCIPGERLKEKNWSWSLLWVKGLNYTNEWDISESGSVFEGLFYRVYIDYLSKIIQKKNIWVIKHSDVV